MCLSESNYRLQGHFGPPVDTLSRVFDISSQLKQKLWSTHHVNGEVKSSKYMLINTGYPKSKLPSRLWFSLFYLDESKIQKNETILKRLKEAQNSNISVRGLGSNALNHSKGSWDSARDLSLQTSQQIWRREALFVKLCFCQIWWAVCSIACFYLRNIHPYCNFKWKIILLNRWARTWTKIVMLMLRSIVPAINLENGSKQLLFKFFSFFLLGQLHLWVFMAVFLYRLCC